MLDLAARPSTAHDRDRIGMTLAMTDVENDDDLAVARVRRQRIDGDRTTDIRLLEKDFEFLARGLKSTEANITLRIDAVAKQFADFISEARTTFATKSELAELKNKQDAIQESISWVVKIVLGCVLVGILALVIRSGAVSALHGTP